MRRRRTGGPATARTRHRYLPAQAGAGGDRFDVIPPPGARSRWWSATSSDTACTVVRRIASLDCRVFRMPSPRLAVSGGEVRAEVL
ncbi:hypothetical protein [Kitasatospora sp. NBC_00315]|uniref:hypothetical protein n=1 Tax=Kitasatospora sp. NBC_00315 TaxID=2975963 RepID=UPI00352D2491